jgi:hypothetical protein
MSKNLYIDEEKNVNNIIRLSWPLHQRFDGLHTHGLHSVPQIAIRFVRSEGITKVTVSPGFEEMRYKVIIIITSLKAIILVIVTK